MRNRIKFLALAIFILCQSISVFGNKISVRVDERAELLSIIFRLAEVPPYSWLMNYPYYDSCIHAYFGESKEHPTVKEARKIAEKYGVTFDRVMEMAFAITSPPNIQPRKCFSEVDFTYTPADSIRYFVEFIEKFYQDTKFESFYQSHSDIYAVSQKRMEEATKGIDFDWFENNFDRQQPQINIIASVSNGGASYAATIPVNDSVYELYSVISTNKITNGYPFFGKNTTTVIHETLHYFVNNFVEKQDIEFESFYPALFEKTKEISEKQAYGSWESSLKESLVRVLEIKYMIDHGDSKEDIQKSIEYEIKRGFYWIGDLTNAVMKVYGKNNPNSTFESKFPELIEEYRKIASRADLLYEQNLPILKTVDPNAEYLLPVNNQKSE